MIDDRGSWSVAAMLTYILAISIGALALAIPVRGAGAQVPVSLDHDHDGVVSRKEFDDTRETSFGRIDQNGDDVLTASEFIQRPSGPSGTRPGVTRLDELRRRRFADLDTNNDGNVSHAEYMDFGRRLFAAIDADRDGRLSSDEFKRFRPGTTARRDQPVPTDRASQVFAALDADGDGVLTVAEIETTRDRAFSRADGNGDGTLTREEFQAGRSGPGPASAVPPELQRRSGTPNDRRGTRFDELDRNKDGVVTRAEYITDGRARFAAADRNRDRRLTKAEFRAYRPGAK